MRSVMFSGLVVVFGVLACGGGSEGYRQIASGSALEVEMSGPMSGSWTILPADSAHLDGEVGLYGPTMAHGVQGGSWIAKRTVALEESSEPWRIEAEGPRTASVTWSGGCGDPAPGQMASSILLFPGEPDSTVQILVTLTGSGSAKFEGSGVPDRPGHVVMEGQWTLMWCKGGPDAAVGPGIVEFTWTVDSSTLRSWDAPKRGAW